MLEHGGLGVLTDPMLGARGRAAFVLPKHPSTGVPDAPIARYVEPAPLAFGELAAIVISHTHADHVDATAKAVLPKELPLVVAAAGADAMRAAGFRDVRALDWGESTTLTKGTTSLAITAVPAHHAHDATLDHELGRGNGYVLAWTTPAGTFRAYWTGDAVLADESRELVARFGAIDLLVPHLGAVGSDGALGLRTMDADETLQLVDRIAPRWVVPIHHTTFGHYREPVEALRDAFGRTERRGAELHVLATGERFSW